MGRIMLILPKSAIDPLKKYRTTHRTDIDENDFSDRKLRDPVKKKC